MTTEQNPVRRTAPGEGDAVDVLGVLLQRKVPSADTGGRFCITTATVPAGTAIPIHSHLEVEAFYLLEGDVEFARLEDGLPQWFQVKPRELVFIPSEQMHGFRNTGPGDANLLIVCERGLEDFFWEAGKPAGSPGQPTPSEIQHVVGIAIRRGQRFLPQ